MDVTNFNQEQGLRLKRSMAAGVFGYFFAEKVLPKKPVTCLSSAQRNQIVKNKGIVTLKVKRVSRSKNLE